MKEIILIKNGELALKGLNRSSFESTLAKNIKRRLQSLGKFKVIRSQSTITVEPFDESFDMEEAEDQISRIFGIAGYERAAAVEKNMGVILKTTPVYLSEALKSASTFKVEAKRADKTFPLKSPEICCDVGEAVLNAFPHIRVNVKNPDLTIVIEIRENAAYIHGDQKKGAGGMPVGTGGKAALLISGGIDSPVAGWMMAKRGVVLNAVHFASPPFTSPMSEMKVHDLLAKVAKYSGTIKLITVPFTEIQENIRDKCPEELFTLIMRRYMMRISNILAEKEGCEAVVTGESVGQVASQTLTAMMSTDSVSRLPVLRPLVGMDKNEIVVISRKIDTFDISIRPFEDCCTVFTPKHPRLHPKPEEIEKAELSLDSDALISRAVEGVKQELITF